MAQSKTDVLQGTLSLLVLKTVARGPIHGYGITQHIQQASHDLLRVEEGSLYPALHRMEQQGWIRSEWGVSNGNRRARFYELTELGQQQLRDEEVRWDRLITGVREVLQWA